VGPHRSLTGRDALTYEGDGRDHGRPSVPIEGGGRADPIDPAHLAEGSAPLLARCRFPDPGTEVTCAVSGGADSMALLALAVAGGCRASAVHVDLGLRPGSQAEGDVVEAFAARLAVEVRRVQVEVEPGPNLEARARAARHVALPAGTLLGHTADDQAETMLLNLLRGAGLDGLAAMAPDERRPILALRRSETVALCASLGVEPVHDPSNDDPAFRRNRVRHEVLPLLDDVADRDVAAVLARQAELLRDAADVLAGAAAQLDVTDAPTLGAAPPAIARVAVREWLRACSPEAHPPDAATVERVLAVARLEQRATDIGGGWRVARTAGRLRLVPPPSGVR
jgi:tRNA(Ile)-lysidine synthase